MSVAVLDVLEDLKAVSTSEADKGSRFERLIAAYLKADPAFADQFEDVWLWQDWPGRLGRHDTGIDLVASTREGGCVAIQCKFYDPHTTISKGHIDSFLSASGKSGFTERIIVSTTDRWNPHAEDAIVSQQIPVRRIGLHDLDASPVDWSRFSAKTPDVLELVDKHHPRPHQITAITAVVQGFETSPRGKLIMACGTGKTYTALRLAEQLAGTGGTVLFLVPSISLLSQSLREWTNEASVALAPVAVCSDAKATRRSSTDDDQDISAVDLALPATTDPGKIRSRLAAAVQDRSRMTVVFSTYQSIQVLADAMAGGGIDPFDLVICDEAHRTTGVTLSGADESAFVRIHDETFIPATRRLYMTATPRIYTDTSKQKAAEGDAVLCSMDDPDLFGPEFHRLGFGEAVGNGLLTDYKVLVLAVDETAVAKTFQQQLADEYNELRLDDAAKIVGCWNGLAKRGETEHSFATDPAPMRRAVAFSRTIKDSKAIQRLFTQVVNQYIDAHDLDDPDREGPDVLRTQIEHVDGTFNALLRNQRLNWLKAAPDEHTCRILTNARCLSEGVDVPALDAVLFLNPRNSVVDVVQSVGRVMRRAPGKKYGYIILPIGIPAGMTPEDALADNARYKVVWDVLQALRAHDERFDAMVNKLDLNTKRTDTIQVIGVGGGGPSEDRDSAERGRIGRGDQGRLDLVFPDLDDWREAIYAKLVAKVGSRRYWETWAGDIAQIAERHITRITALLDDPTGTVQAAFEQFLTGLRGNLNPGITRADAIEMLAQHLVSRPVFDALFQGYSFAEHNPVAQTMEAMLTTLDEHQLDDENTSLAKFYESVRLRAAGIDNPAARQRLLVELYDSFFKNAFPRAVAKLGIVYTPIEIVDFILHSADWALHREFGAGLTSPGVHILDGFTGTGTFITRLLTSGLINPEDLARKYATELHANEILLLAYYIAAVNIETTYQDQTHTLTGSPDYVPFPGLVLADTFQMYEDDDHDDLGVFVDNNERLTAQRDLDIRVIIGNPPYSAGQDSANDNNQNERYPHLDAAIRDTYAARSTATLKNSLYDSYIRAIKWATHRVKDHGVIAYVTNGGFIDSNTADGLRQTLADEFSHIYIYNLRGNARTAGEPRKKEGGTVFDAGSRATVAITILVKNADHHGPATIHYTDIGDYLTRDDKLKTIAHAGSIQHLHATPITPNAAGDWLDQRSDDFTGFIPIGAKDHPSTGIFALYTGGLKTNRDAWCYNSSSDAVHQSMHRMVATYEADRVRLATDPSAAVNTKTTEISWDVQAEAAARKGERRTVEPAALRTSAYRPFQRQRVYFSPKWNPRQGRLPAIFPDQRHDSIGFVVMAPRPEAAPAALMTGELPDLSYFTYTGQFFPRWTWEKVVADDALFSAGSGEVVDGYRRVDNITDEALRRFRATYGPAVTKDDVFFYVYGLLHSPDYRQRYAADLKKMLPRIPLVQRGPDFMEAGRRLSELHLGYESVPPYPLEGLAGGPGVDDPTAYAHFAVQKMTFGKATADQKKAGAKTDRSTIVYNSHITLRGVPEDAHRYMLGSRSAIEWIMDRYQVRVDKPSGIKNDPNDWSREVGNPRYIIDLLARIVTVSLETTKIVDALPPLDILPDQGQR